MHVNVFNGLATTKLQLQCDLKVQKQKGKKLQQCMPLLQLKVFASEDHKILYRRCKRLQWQNQPKIWSCYANISVFLNRS